MKPENNRNLKSSTLYLNKSYTIYIFRQLYYIKEHNNVVYMLDKKIHLLAFPYLFNQLRYGYAKTGISNRFTIITQSSGMNLK